MNVDQIREILLAKFEGDHTRKLRMIHFMSQIKAGLDGMAGIGVIFELRATGLNGEAPLAPPVDPISSLETAIELMQNATRRM